MSSVYLFQIFFRQNSSNLHGLHKVRYIPVCPLKIFKMLEKFYSSPIMNT